MRKLILGLLLSCMVLLATGCSPQNLGNMNFLKSAGKQKIDEDINQIITAIEHKDSDSIKEMMAEMALNDMEQQRIDIDKQIQELFDFYQGTMQSCEYKSGRETTRHGDEGEYGQRIKRMASGAYTVTTDKDVYLLYVYDNIKSVTSEEEGVFCISIIKYSDYYDLNLGSFSNEADTVCGIHVADVPMMAEMEQRLKVKGEESGFHDVIYGYAGTTGGCCDYYYKEGSVDQIARFIEMFSSDVQIDRADVERLFKILDYNMGEGVEEVKGGFNDPDRLMYCEGIVYITDVDQEECPTLHRIKMKWQKCKDDARSGLTYFAIMSEEDYQAGKEFPEGEGLIIIE